jgi:hypothetical protein
MYVQRAIVLTMANTFCEMIWSDTTLSGAEKATHFKNMMQDVFTPASGPAPISRTDGRGGRSEIRGSLMVLASADLSPMSLVAENQSEFKLPEPQTGFLRDPPFFINDYRATCKTAVVR